MSLTGFRWWLAARHPEAGWQLKSVARPMDIWWEGPHLRAELPPRGWRCRRDDQCDWGRRRCHCGIHAFKSLEQALAWAVGFEPWALRARIETGRASNPAEGSPRASNSAEPFFRIIPYAYPGPRKDYPVWGSVAVWGKVVEHEHGYRAEHAMIRHLIVPKRFVIIRANANGTPTIRGDSVLELVEMPDRTLPATLGQRYGVDVGAGNDIEIVASNEYIGPRV